MSHEKVPDEMLLKDPELADSTTLNGIGVDEEKAEAAKPPPKKEVPP